MFPRVLIVALWSSSLALAQEDVTPSPTLPPPPPVEPQPKAVVADPPVAKMMPPAPTARERRGGTVGVGYLGLSSMTPLGGLSGLGGLGGLGSLLLTKNQVPLLGVRWWFRNSRIGLDAGLGAMMSTGIESLQFSSVPSLQLVGHVGLPIAVASTQHVIVLLAPEFRAGFSTSVSGGSNEATGSLLELALRGGIELFFSFIGVPELSLEAAVRVGVAREAQGFSFISPLGPGGGTTSFEVFRFSTSLSGDAGSIIASTLSLKYYF